MTQRPSPWTTGFAKRAYLSGVFWLAGILLDRMRGQSHLNEGIGLRLDPAGLAYLAASITGGLNFFGGGWRAARSLKLDMNFLMSVAIIAALAIDEAFEAATIAFLFSMAELLERFAVDRSRRAITRLLELAPEIVDRVHADGRVERVAASTLDKGHHIRVRPGDRIAADGTVISGESSVNESTITGESLPRAKKPGDGVFAGTLNVDGGLDIEVTTDPEHSLLARIVKLVQMAGQQRAPIEQFVDRFSRFYTPIVTVLAVLVMVVPLLASQPDPMEWFRRGLTLLVVACPCALVIATPVTVVSALTSAARHGVLIKGGVYLEELGRVRAVAVDKTGTMTRGALAVVDVQTRSSPNPDAALRSIASLEARSEHPIAEAIVAYAEGLGIRGTEQVERFQSYPGRGVEGIVSGVTLKIGTEELVGQEIAQSWTPAPPGTIRIYVAGSDSSLAVVDLRDEVRSNSKATVDRLHQIGIKPVVMLTGDSQEVADAVASQTGVDLVRGRLLPEEKVEAVRQLGEQHGSVAMVGDGVNDAPALAAANVGIAMGGAGSPATIETADVALMNDEIGRLPYLFELGRRTRRTIRFNVALSLGLKAVLAVGAVAGVVSLAAAVIIGDLGASIAVTLNALRIAGIRPNA